MAGAFFLYNVNALSSLFQVIDNVHMYPRLQTRLGKLIRLVSARRNHPDYRLWLVASSCGFISHVIASKCYKHVLEHADTFGGTLYQSLTQSTRLLNADPSTEYKAQAISHVVAHTALAMRAKAGFLVASEIWENNDCNMSILLRSLIDAYQSGIRECATVRWLRLF